MQIFGWEEKGKDIENLFNKIIAANFPTLGKIWAHEFRRPMGLQTDMARKRSSVWHITVKLSKVQSRVLRTTRQKHQVTLKRISIMLTAEFLEIFYKHRREWNDIFQVLKESNCQPRVLYSKHHPSEMKKK